MNDLPESLEERTKYIYETLRKGERLNLRCEERKAVFQPCEVRANGRRLKGIIKNMSKSGAMLAGFDLDNQFTPKLELLSFSGAPKKFEIVWRQTDLVGIRFI